MATIKGAAFNQVNMVILVSINDGNMVWYEVFYGMILRQLKNGD